MWRTMSSDMNLAMFENASIYRAVGHWMMLVTLDVMVPWVGFNALEGIRTGFVVGQCQEMLHCFRTSPSSILGARVATWNRSASPFLTTPWPSAVRMISIYYLLPLDFTAAILFRPRSSLLPCRSGTCVFGRRSTDLQWPLHWREHYSLTPCFLLP